MQPCWICLDGGKGSLTIQCRFPGAVEAKSSGQAKEAQGAASLSASLARALGEHPGAPRPRGMNSLVQRRRRFGCSGGGRLRLALSLALLVLLAVVAPRSSWAFHPKPSTAVPTGSPRRSSLHPALLPPGGRWKTQQQLGMAGGKKGDENGGDGVKKQGMFGVFFGVNKDDDSEEDLPRKAAKPENEDTDGIVRSISRRFFQRGRSSSEGEDGSKKSKKEKDKNLNRSKTLGGIEVDISTFVGPKIPSTVATADKNDKVRVKQAKIELKSRREEQLKAQRDKRNKAKAEAAQKAREAAEERKKKTQKEKDARERQKLIMKAAQTKGGSAGSASAAVSDEAGDSGGGGVTKSAAAFLSNLWDSVFSKEKGEEWVVVCPKTRLSPSEIVPVEVAGLSLLVVVSKDGQTIHAISNSCPHLGTPLETGQIDRRLKPGVEAGPGQEPSAMGDECYEECIVCPLHNTAFELNTGEVRGEWCPYPPVIGKVMGTVKAKTNLPKFDIRTRGKNVEVRLNTSLE